MVPGAIASDDELRVPAALPVNDEFTLGHRRGTALRHGLLDQDADEVFLRPDVGRGPFLRIEKPAAFGARAIENLAHGQPLVAGDASNLLELGGNGDHASVQPRDLFGSTSATW
jgi:hypothetical protein